jgi:hypothetical protein
MNTPDNPPIRLVRDECPIYFWATLSSPPIKTPDYPAFRGHLFIEGLEGASLTWIAGFEGHLYAFFPLDPEFYIKQVKHLIIEGAEFRYHVGPRELAIGRVVKVEDNCV